MHESDDPLRRPTVSLPSVAGVPPLISSSSTKATTVSLIATLSSISSSSPGATGGFASSSASSTAPRRRRMTVTEVTNHAVEWTAASIVPRNDGAQETFPSPDADGSAGVVGPSTNRTAARRRPSVGFDDDADGGGSSSLFDKWSSVVRTAFSEVVVRCAQRCYARLAAPLHGMLTREESDAQLMSTYERYQVRASQANPGAFNLFRICTGGGVRYVNPIGEVLADLNAVARSSVSAALSLSRCQRRSDPVSERDAFEFVELGPSPHVVVLLWKSRKSCKLFMRAVRGVNLALRCCLCPSNIRGLLVSCVLELQNETMATVVWLPPLVSCEPVRISSPSAMDPVSHVLLCLHEFLLHGHRYCIEAPSVDLYCAADGSLVAVPGKQLIDALACSRPLTKFVDALLRPCLPSLSAPVHRALSSLKQLVLAGIGTADRRTLLRDTLHSGGCRMVQLLELRDLLADMCTRDSVTLWAKSISARGGGIPASDASDLVDVLWKRFSELHALMLAEAMARTLKNFVLARHARSTPLYAATIEECRSDAFGSESTSGWFGSEKTLQDFESAASSLPERGRFPGDDDGGASSAFLGTSSSVRWTLGRIAAHVFARFCKSKAFFVKHLLPAMSNKFRVVEHRGCLLDPATIPRSFVKEFLQHRLGLSDAAFVERTEDAGVNEARVAPSATTAPAGRRSRATSAVSLAPSLSFSILSLGASTRRSDSVVVDDPPPRGGSESLTRTPRADAAGPVPGADAPAQHIANETRQGDTTANSSVPSSAFARRRSSVSRSVREEKPNRASDDSVNFVILSSSVRPLPGRSSSSSSSRDVIAMSEAAFGFLGMNAASTTSSLGRGAERDGVNNTNQHNSSSSSEFSSHAFRSASFLMTCYWSLTALLRDFKSGISVVLSCSDPRIAKQQPLFPVVKATLHGVFCILQEVAPTIASRMTISRSLAATGATPVSSRDAVDSVDRGSASLTPSRAMAVSADADVFECQQFRSTLPVISDSSRESGCNSILFRTERESRTSGEESGESVSRFGSALWTLWMCRATGGGLPDSKSFMLTLAWALMEQPTYRTPNDDDGVSPRQPAKPKSQQETVSHTRHAIGSKRNDNDNDPKDGAAKHGRGSPILPSFSLFGSHFASTPLLEYFLQLVEHTSNSDLLHEHRLMPERKQQPETSTTELSLLLASAAAACALLPMTKRHSDTAKDRLHVARKSSSGLEVEEDDGEGRSKRQSSSTAANGRSTDGGVNAAAVSVVLRRRVRFIAEQLCTDTRWYALMCSSSASPLTRLIRRVVLDVALRCDGEAGLETTGFVLLLLVAPNLYPNWVCKCCADAVQKRAVVLATAVRERPGRATAVTERNLEPAAALQSLSPPKAHHSPPPMLVTEVCGSPSLFWSVPFGNGLQEGEALLRMAPLVETHVNAEMQDEVWKQLSSEIDRQVLFCLRRAALLAWQCFVESEAIAHIRHPSVRGVAYVPERVAHERIRCFHCFPRGPDETFRNAKITSQIIRHERHVERPVKLQRQDASLLDRRDSHRESEGLHDNSGSSTQNRMSSDARRRSTNTPLSAAIAPRSVVGEVDRVVVPPNKFIAQLSQSLCGNGRAGCGDGRKAAMLSLSNDAEDKVPSSLATACGGRLIGAVLSVKTGTTNSDSTATHIAPHRLAPRHDVVAGISAPPVSIPFPPSQESGNQRPRKFVAQLQHGGTATNLFAFPERRAKSMLIEDSGCEATAPRMPFERAECDGRGLCVSAGCAEKGLPSVISISSSFPGAAVGHGGGKYVGQLGSCDALAAVRRRGDTSRQPCTGEQPLVLRGEDEDGKRAAVLADPAVSTVSSMAEKSSTPTEKSKSADPSPDWMKPTTGNSLSEMPTEVPLPQPVKRFFLAPRSVGNSRGPVSVPPSLSVALRDDEVLGPK